MKAIIRKILEKTYISQTSSLGDERHSDAVEIPVT
jgi:hypothetical protein